MTVRTFTLQQ